MASKKINITIPEEILKKINEFCISENVNKSWLIREATSQYIENIYKQKELENKKHLHCSSTDLPSYSLN